ncbi:phage tail protein [Mangrovivirga sp. M17]|uniref:Phage tail protein n=1 Tax=Mangrovivirga halotolerans TaxID=2993936 RepID=A0ABT3RLW5_9BACT|nr:phage tail protein [Mangrovivirga halotolerans]MCX2742699.1 phage tail protein [Mangrovivirga halotolerans]
MTDINYPIPGFRFAVSLMKKDGVNTGQSKQYDNNFMEVSGISVEMPTEEFQEGGENRFIHRFPQPLKYPNLVLKRGRCHASSSFVDWCKNTFEVGLANGVTPNNIVIKLLGEDMEPLFKWTFYNAYPVKWSVSGLNSQSNELVIESIELAYQRFEEELK